MEEQLQAIVTVLSLVNPVVCGAMFARIEANRSPVERRADAMKVALAIVVILTVAALIGTRLLHLFGVSLDAFMVAGGGVLAWMGFSMLSGQASSSPASPEAPSKSWGVTDALDSVRGKPRDDHRSNYTFRCPYTVGFSSHRPGGSRDGKCFDVAGHAARRSRCPPKRWRWICANFDNALHGADRPVHGGSVCAYRTSPVRQLKSGTLPPIRSARDKFAFERLRHFPRASLSDIG